MRATIISLSLSHAHTFSKTTCASVTLLQGLGVEGDAQCGATVKHRSRVAQDPTQPNLRQVHLLQAELFDDLAQQGFTVMPGDLGENVATRGIALLDLPAGTRLQLGQTAIVELTGLRNPCVQIDRFAPGLMAAVLGRAPDGSLIRKAGVMGIVIAGGTVNVHDSIELTLPDRPHRKLERV